MNLPVLSPLFLAYSGSTALGLRYPALVTFLRAAVNWSIISLGFSGKSSPHSIQRYGVPVSWHIGLVFLHAISMSVSMAFNCSLAGGTVSSS